MSEEWTIGTRFRFSEDNSYIGHCCNNERLPNDTINVIVYIDPDRHYPIFWRAIDCKNPDMPSHNSPTKGLPMYCDASKLSTMIDWGATIIPEPTKPYTICSRIKSLLEE